MNRQPIRKVIGIQPNLADTAWAVIRRGRSDRFQHIASGVIYIENDAYLVVKYASIYNKISDLLTRHTPDLLAIESFSAKNADVQAACQAVSAKETNALSPACVIAGLQFAAAIADIHARLLIQKDVHAIIGGGENAPKSLVEKMVSALLEININDSNAAGAAAVAIAGILHRHA
jgi:Holliday junction resolvasome RuvABC endonuclease subunit